MVAQKYKKGKSKYQSTQREVRPEVFKDSVSYNQLNDSILTTDKKQRERNEFAQSHKKYKVDKLTTSKEQQKVRLYGKKVLNKNRGSQKIQIDEDKDLPRLNRSIIPGMKFKRGKKGKKFIEDNDELVWSRLVKSVGDKYEEINESKLEKNRRLEEIREIKRKEIELKEQKKSEQLEEKKHEIKNKSSMARSMRRKNKRLIAKETEEELSSDKKKQKKKSVSFA